MLSISPFSPLALSLYSQHTSNGQAGGYLRASSCLKRRRKDTPFFFAGIVRLTAATLLFSLFYIGLRLKRPRCCCCCSCSIAKGFSHLTFRRFGTRQDTLPFSSIAWRQNKRAICTLSSCVYVYIYL